MPSNLFRYWNIAPDELSEIIDQRPSLRGMIEGYIAEYKLKKMLQSDARIKEVGKYNNHDRKKRGDLFVVYKGKKIGIEVKGLQTVTIQKAQGKYFGKFQCDASDRRRVTLPNGTVVETTCLKVGEFDLLAVNLFGFLREWKFAFAKNQDLPRTEFSGYASEVRRYLLATMMEITWPLKPPFEENPFKLIDEIV